MASLIHLLFEVSDLSLISIRFSLLAGVLLALSSTAVAADVPVTVVNGGFEQTAIGTSNELNFHNQANSGVQQVTGWISNYAPNGDFGYNFVYTPGSADTTGAFNQYGQQMTLWGINNGGVNAITSSPLGGNFLAMNGAYNQGTLSQTLNGLTPGLATQVSFYYAGAQQYGYGGPTTEAFIVSLGSESRETTILNDANHGFTGWNYTTLNFTPTAATETLSFLAAGTPGGEPPFSLLDGVSVVQVAATPEPSSLALLGTGLLTTAGFLRRRMARS